MNLETLGFSPEFHHSADLSPPCSLSFSSFTTDSWSIGGIRRRRRLLSGLGLVKNKDMEKSGEATAEKPATGRKTDNEKVSFYRLFSFADKLDVGLMIAGTVCAIANGMSQPLMTLLFGHLINTFGGSEPFNVVHEVSKVCSEFWFSLFRSPTQLHYLHVAASE